MPLSAGAYAAAAAELVAIAGALALAAVSLRRWLLPGWAGAPARLVEVVAGIALLVVIGELLGLFGLFEEPILVAAAIVTGLSVPWLVTSRISAAPVSPAPVPPAPPASGPAKVVAAVACVALAATWAIPTGVSLVNGILGVDSVWYHLPQAARFVQTGSVTGLLFTDPYFVNWYYPANAELLHGIGMLVSGRDALSPVLNLGFLALALLAAWSIGRPFGLGPHTLVAASIVLGSEMFLDFQPGEARNDIAALAFFLASVALLVNGAMAAKPANPITEGPASLPAGPVTGGPPGALRHRYFSRPGGVPPPVPPAGGSAATLMFGGLAAGLALGTKLTLVAPVGALTLGVVAIAGKGMRWATAGVWVAALAVGGGFWYVRNLVHAGNPLPWVESLGPIPLPAPDSLELRPRFSVSHYATDLDVWMDWFFPGLADSIGPLWLLVLALAAAAAAFATWRGEALFAMFGAVVLATLGAYVFTPLTASGREGAPIGFVWNLRYIAPALALGLALLPLLAPLRRTRSVSAWSFLALVATAAVTLAALDVWDRGRHEFALAAAVLVIAGFALARSASPRRAPGSRSPVVLAAALGALAIAALAAGYQAQRTYLDNRYEDSLRELRLDRPAAWAQGVRDARIAVAGRGGAFFQYPFYGPDLSNRVQWIGRPGPHGAWLPVTGCRQWREAVADGRYDYVVTTYDGRFPGTDRTSDAREWTRTDPAAEQILRERPSTVFRLDGPLDPGGCPT